MRVVAIAGGCGTPSRNIRKAVSAHAIVIAATRAGGTSRRFGGVDMRPQIKRAKAPEAMPIRCEQTVFFVEAGGAEGTPIKVKIVAPRLGKTHGR